MTVYGAYGGNSYQDSNACPNKPIKVMMIGDTAVYGGKHALMNEVPNFNLRIRLGNDPWLLADSAVSGDAGAKAILHKEVFNVNYPATLDLDWQDFSVPKFLDRVWWQALTDSLSDLGPSLVGVYCQGGHGRTGTALSILAALSHQTDGDPVQWVREHYCTEAVESTVQINYIRKMTGVPILAKPTDEVRFGYLKNAQDGDGGYSDPGSTKYNRPKETKKDKVKRLALARERFEKRIKEGKVTSVTAD